MNAMRSLILLVATVIVVGFIALWLIKALLGLLVYLVIGAFVVGGSIYLYRKIRNSLTADRARQVRR